MKMHHFLFATMLIAGAWITSFKASYFETQSRTPDTATTQSVMKEMSFSAGH